MPDILSALDTEWRALAASRDGAATLTRWQEVEPELAAYADLDQLAAAARNINGAGADLDHRDRLQRALYRLAQTDPDAQLAVLWLVFPALRRAAGAYVGIWTFDEAAAIAVGAALDRIIRFPHETLRPAPCTIRWVRRALGREAMFARRHRAEVTRADNDIELADDPQTHPSDELLDLIHGALRAGYLRPAGARLIIEHRIRGTRTAATSEETGYPAATIRQRRNRAEAQLATWARHAA